MVKKANSYEEVAYYYLAQSAIQRGKTEEATEYINQSGWASNFAKLYLKKLKLENSPSAYEKWKDFKKDLNPATLISEIGEFIFYFGSSKKDYFQITYLLKNI